MMAVTDNLPTDLIEAKNVMRARIQKELFGLDGDRALKKAAEIVRDMPLNRVEIFAAGMVLIINESGPEENNAEGGQ